MAGAFHGALELERCGGPHANEIEGRSGQGGSAGETSAASGGMFADAVLEAGCVRDPAIVQASGDVVAEVEEVDRQRGFASVAQLSAHFMKSCHHFFGGPAFSVTLPQPSGPRPVPV